MLKQEVEKEKIWTLEGERWRQKMCHADGNYSQRVLNEKAEEDFWEAYISKREIHEVDPYSIKISERVCKLLQESANLGNCSTHSESKLDSILEIGPGWGNYTFDLADICKELTILDGSQAVLDYLLRMSEKYARGSLQTIKGKWEEKETDIFDAVFAYNCFYRMTEIEKSLMKIYETAKKVCIIGMNNNPEQAFFEDFEKELGLTVHHSRMDARDLKKILESLDIKIDREINIPNERDYIYENFEDLYSYASSRIMSPFNENEVREILASHYQLADGKYLCRHKFTSKLLVCYK